MNTSDIKQKAFQLNAEYNPDGLVPFPFETLVSSRDDLSIIRLKVDSSISGAIYCQDDKFTIIINNSKPEVRQYFTLAHEFGHLYLHQEWLRENASNAFVDVSFTLDNGNMLLRPDEPNIANIDLDKEREANNFAAELIMPEDKVKEFWNLTHDIRECATAFQVSNVAMAVRLDRLGLA